eukprot:1195277-Prorocentrum_minimum.AAC.3
MGWPQQQRAQPRSRGSIIRPEALPKPESPISTFQKAKPLEWVKYVKIAVIVGLLLTAVLAISLSNPMSYLSDLFPPFLRSIHLELLQGEALVVSA